jgi:hypothetical protein
MDDSPPRIERHEAVDRFGKKVLRTAHDLTAALAENGRADEEPIVLRTDGPHRSIEGLMALIDEALDDDRPSGGTADGGAGQGGGS